MPPVDVLVWLNNKQETILSRWQKAVREQALPAFSRLDDESLKKQLEPLYRAVIKAVETRSAVAEDDLLAWTQYHQKEQQASLTDILKIAFALRTAVGDTLMESSDAFHAIAAWQTLFPYFDQATAILSEIYTRAVEQTLTERLLEAQRLTDSLTQATSRSERALAQLRSVFAVSQVLGSSLDMDEILGELVRKLGQALQARHCAVWLSDIGPMNMTASYHEAGEMHIPPELTSLPEVLETVLYSGQSQVMVFDETLPPDDIAFMRAFQIEIVLVAPLTIQGIPIGALTLGRADRKAVFEPTEIELVESLLRQAGVAIQNAGLYDEIRAINDSLEVRIAARTKELAREKERIETLYAISGELSASLDLNQVLQKTLHLISQAVGARHGSIMLLDRLRNVLVFRARLGGDRPLPPEGEVSPFKPGVGVAGWVLEHREPVLVRDVLQDERWMPGGAQTRSLMAVPLMIGDELLGVIIISDAEPNKFDEENLRLLIASAQQVSQAIRNAQLYKDVNESATRNQAILESIADGVIVNDPEHQVIVFNAAAERILGIRQEIALASDVHNLFDAFESGGRSSALAALEMAAKSAGQSEQAIEITLESQGQVVSGHIAPVITPDRQFLGIVTALRDITREVEADRAKTEFVSTVSHELRTPLTSIKGYIDLLYAGAAGPINEVQKRFMGIVKNNADRLTLLINDLLDISRIETGRLKLDMKAVDMVQVVGEVAESLRGQIEEKGLRLELTMPSQPIEVYGDRARLIQIVTNLLSNAYKYTDEGWIHLTVSMVEDNVRIDVADSGIGISLEDQTKIFERFYRADTPVVEGRGGTGLGLSITKDLIELHGGRIWVQSELGVGSTFTVLLPSLQRKAPVSMEKLTVGAKKILVVDDDRDIVSLLRYQLQARGYQVIVAATGDQAIRRAIEEQPSLITLDILLPDRNGFEVLRELKERQETAHIPVIVLSVVQDETSGYRLGAADYITKPVTEDRLLDSISRVLGAKGKILIAEDDISTAEMLIALLERHEFQVFHAKDGYEALAFARRERPGLILLDLKMPGMDGYEALARLKKDPETRRIPILAMSAHTVDPVQERARLQQMGAYDLFAKPFDLDELVAEIIRMQSETQEHE